MGSEYIRISGILLEHGYHEGTNGNDLPLVFTRELNHGTVQLMSQSFATMTFVNFGVVDSDYRVRRPGVGHLSIITHPECAPFDGFLVGDRRVFIC